MIRNLVVFVFFLLLVLKITLAVIYSDQWAVHIEGNDYDANRIASKYGFINLGQILPGYYHFVHRKVAKRSLEPNSEHHAKLSLEPQVRWAKQQTVRKRVKRDFRGIQLQKTKLNDPRWPQMWYLNRGEGLDMNVQKAWVQGITGKGVVVTILDDGLEKDHPDIKRNYSPKASYDVNNHDEDPQPRYDSIDSNRHGTRCAGEVAANANNSICAVGVAYDASIGGVRMLDGDVTDAVEARSLSLNPQHIAIYSASWGPDDDGKTVDGPGELATRAFKEGITHGRNGFGSIFVWASGNGGRDHDNCNCDGYTNSIWTLSISSATENGLVPWYSEACSSTLATTYSSGSSSEKQVITTDLHHGCTSSHTGTSASAPLAAGICALALQVNSKLTWRDMQHIVVRSARPANLRAPDWATNGIGRNVSHSFGYGLMDASAMVEYARNWTTVPEQKTCYVRTPQRDKLIPAKSEVKLQVNVDCPEVKYLEHVQAKISLAATRRGDIHIFLISPMGTRSTLLAIRPHDNSRSGFQAWPFMTVHCWGENPTGVWTLEIHNEGRYQGRATLGEWHLIFYGTTEDPDHQVHSTDSSSSTSSSTTSSTTSISKITTTSAAAAAAAAAITTTTTTSTITNNNIPYPVPQPFPSMPSVYPGDNSVLHDDRSGSHPDQAAKQTLQNGAASISDWHLIHYGTKESPDSGSVKDQPLSSVESSACKQTNASRACLDCPDGYHQEGSKCVITCQPQTYLVSDNLQKKQYCQPCHYTCFNCSGPNDYQCTSCFGDAVLDSGYCQPLRFYSELKDTKKWYTALTVMFIIFAIIIVVLIICLINKDKKHYFAKNIKKFKYFSMPQMDHSSPNTIDSAEEM